MGPLAVLCRRPEYLELVFDSKEQYKDYGLYDKETFICSAAYAWCRYAFKFYRRGTWTQVFVDDLIPCVAGEPLYARSSNRTCFFCCYSH